MVGMEMLEKLWLHKYSEYGIQKTLCSEREVRERRCYKGWLPGFWQNKQDDNITGNRNTSERINSSKVGSATAQAVSHFKYVESEALVKHFRRDAV